MQIRNQFVGSSGYVVIHMKMQFTEAKSPTPTWQLLHKIDNCLGQPLPLAKRLEKINDVLIEALAVDAIWFIVNNPLPPTACGVMRTPLTVDPQAKISIVDINPPAKNSWPPANTLLGKAITQQEPIFVEPNNFDVCCADSDLGDVLFNTFNTTPLAIVPLIVDSTALGALVIGNKAGHTTVLSEEIHNMLAFLGKHLAQNLHNAYLVERSARHAEVLLTLNQIAQTITSSLDIDDVIQKTMTGINTILAVEAVQLFISPQGFIRSIISSEYPPFDLP